MDEEKQSSQNLQQNFLYASEIYSLRSTQQRLLKNVFALNVDEGAKKTTAYTGLTTWKERSGIDRLDDLYSVDSGDVCSQKRQIIRRAGENSQTFPEDNVVISHFRFTFATYALSIVFHSFMRAILASSRSDSF